MPWRRVSKTKRATSRRDQILWVMSQVQPSAMSDFAAAEGAQRERWLQCLLEFVDKSSGSSLRPTVREFAVDERRAGERIRERA